MRDSLVAERSKHYAQKSQHAYDQGPSLTALLTHSLHSWVLNNVWHPKSVGKIWDFWTLDGYWTNIFQQSFCAWEDLFLMKCHISLTNDYWINSIKFLYLSGRKVRFETLMIIQKVLLLSIYHQLRDGIKWICISAVLKIFSLIDEICIAVF